MRNNYFDVEQWINSLQFMAKKTLDLQYVIAMNLRNELRDVREYQTNQTGIVMSYDAFIHEAILSVNSRFLTVISGLNYDLELSLIRLLPIIDLVSQSIQKKIVYEAHWYS